MRIFLAFMQGDAAHDLPPFRFWESYIKEGIAEAGSCWVEAENLDWVAGLLERSHDEQRTWLDSTWTRCIAALREAHRRAPIDLFLSYLFPVQILVEGVEEVRRLGIPTVNFFCDNVRNFRTVPAQFRPFDAHWVPEFEARHMYSSAGLKIYERPMPAFVPPRFRAVPDREEYPPTFIGSNDVVRRQLFEALAQTSVEFEIRGGGWREQAVPPLSRRKIPALSGQIELLRHFGYRAWSRKTLAGVRSRLGLTKQSAIPEELARRVRASPSGDEYFRVMQRSSVAIGVNRYFSYLNPSARPKSYSRLRDIEAPMVGACYLTESAPGLDELYDLGQEIETYSDADEMREKIIELSSDHTRRGLMREKALARSLSDHTIGRTIDVMRSDLGIPT
jgi:hypothetical protein